MLEQNQTKDTSLHVKCRKYPNISICKLCSINIYTKGILFFLQLMLGSSELLLLLN